MYIGINQSYAQIDSTYILSYDSTYNYYVFKPNKVKTVTALINQNSSIFGISNNDALILNRVKSDENGMKNYRYKQYYNNVEVEFTQFYISSDNNNVPISANGALSYNIDINTTPSLSSTQAIDYALNYSNATKYFWEDTVYENTIKEITGNPDTSYYPNARLVILNVNAYNKSLQPNNVLAYKVPIYSLTPFDSYYLYVDAISGNIVFKNQIMTSCFKKANSLPQKTDSIISNKQLYEPESCASPCRQGNANLLYYSINGGQTIFTDRFRYDIIWCTHRLKNTCGYTYLYVVKQNGGDYIDDTNNWTDANDKPGTTALWCLERIHDFFRSAPYYRNSFDGNYTQVKLFAEKTWKYTDCYNNVVTDGQNAYWTGDHIEIGDGSGGDGSVCKPFNNDLTTLDAIGHEFTHGVTDYEANLYNWGEPGALDESFSDIFGTMIDFYGKTNYNTGLSPNYILGEECTSSGGLRDMSNPKSKNQPDTYAGTYWAPSSNTDPDNGGVHTNSGAQNYWFYLLSEGGDGTNDIGHFYCVDGIGRDKAARIVYKSLTDHLVYNSDYVVARFFSIVSAQELYGYNSNEVAQVINAWYAVGLGPSFSGNVEYNNLTVSGTQTISNNNAIVFNNFNTTPTGNFTVTSNTRITMHSTSKASSGSYFHAYITPGCFGGTKMFNNYDNSDENNLTDDFSENADTSNSFLKKIKSSNSNIVTYNPNPNNGIFTISMSGNTDNINSIEIYNTLGNKIYQSDFETNTKLINISQYPKGIYIVKVFSGNEVFVEKVVYQ